MFSQSPKSASVPLFVDDQNLEQWRRNVYYLKTLAKGTELSHYEYVVKIC